jgi:hypothetical protein
MTASQADLLLAMHLDDRGEHLAAARLLELLAVEQRSSDAATKLLQSIYSGLGRSPLHSGEVPLRGISATW